MGYHLLSGQKCCSIPWTAASDEQAILSLPGALDSDTRGGELRSFTRFGRDRHMATRHTDML